MNRTFALHKPYHRGHHVFGWNRNAQVHVIGGSMTFNDLAFFLAYEVAEDRSEFLPQVPKQIPASSFGTKTTWYLQSHFGGTSFEHSLT
jgi:hypothetical protein